MVGTSFKRSEGAIVHMVLMLREVYSNYVISQKYRPSSFLFSEWHPSVKVTLLNFPILNILEDSQNRKCYNLIN